MKVLFKVIEVVNALFNLLMVATDYVAANRLCWSLEAKQVKDAVRLGDVVAIKRGPFIVNYIVDGKGGVFWDGLVKYMEERGQIRDLSKQGEEADWLRVSDLALSISKF